MFWPFFIFGNTLNNDSYIVLLSHYFNVFYIVYISLFLRYIHVHSFVIYNCKVQCHYLYGSTTILLYLYKWVLYYIVLIRLSIVQSWLTT